MWHLEVHVVFDVLAKNLLVPTNTPTNLDKPNLLSLRLLRSFQAQFTQSQAWGGHSLVYFAYTCDNDLLKWGLFTYEKGL
jgi:hypothetical protein